MGAGCRGRDSFIVIVAAPQARIRARGDGRLHVTLIDVGQGDAILVTFPNGRPLVVDTGGASGRGDFDIGDRVVGPMLQSAGVLDLDYLAVTHGDPDHIGGARALVRDFSPREIWWGVPVANHEATSARRAPRLATCERRGAGCSVATGSRSAASRFASIIRRCLIGNVRRCATTTRSCSSCASARSQCCSPATSIVKSNGAAADTRPSARPWSSKSRTTAAAHRARKSSFNTPAPGRAHRRRPRQPVRPPGPIRARAIQGGRDGGVPDGSGRAGDGVDGRACRLGVRTFTGRIWELTRRPRRTRRHEGDIRR